MNLNMDIVLLCVISTCDSEHGPEASSYDHDTENSGCIKGR
jgi:hypothetical protein